MWVVECLLAVDSAKTLLPFLKGSTHFHEIDSEETFNNAFTQLYKTIEPTVVHVRAGVNSAELRKDIIDKLQEQGFVNLDVSSLIRAESDRNTAIGQEFQAMYSAGKIVPSEMMVRMLRRIIYSGDGRNKFILTGFPDIIDQANEFEKNCSHMSAIIYATTHDAQLNAIALLL